MNFRLPEDLKDEFYLICKRKHTYMTSELVRFIIRFVREEVSNEYDLQDKLKKLERPTSKESKLNTWGSRIQDPITKTWMTKEEYYKNEY